MERGGENPVRGHAGHLWLAVVLSCAGTSALAHSGGNLNGFAAGLLHPISGLDHIIAMVAVGLWGGILGDQALWSLPIAFPLIMAFGGVMGVLGVPVPGTQIGIALSGIVLGLMILVSVRVPLRVATVMVGIFAIFHGYAHGAELPLSADPAVFAAGFVLATGFLHLLGIGIGLAVRWPWGKIAVRIVGLVISALGLGFLSGVIVA
jgi:urease accessory protein